VCEREGGRERERESWVHSPPPALRESSQPGREREKEREREREEKRRESMRNKEREREREREKTTEREIKRERERERTWTSTPVPFADEIVFLRTRARPCSPTCRPHTRCLWYVRVFVAILGI